MDWWKKQEICQEVKNLIDIGEDIIDAKDKVAKKYNIHTKRIETWNYDLNVYESKRKKIMDEATQKLEQKITMEEKVQKTNIDMVSNKQNDGR